METLKKLEDEILQIEQLLYILDGDFERIQVDITYTANLKEALLDNITVLKTPGIVIMIDAYKKTKSDLKHLEARVKHNRGLEIEIGNKIASLEKSLVFKEDKKNELLTQFSDTKILEFKRRL